MGRRRLTEQERQARQDLRREMDAERKRRSRMDPGFRKREQAAKRTIGYQIRQRAVNNSLEKERTATVDNSGTEPVNSKSPNDQFQKTNLRSRLRKKPNILNQVPILVTKSHQTTVHSGKSVLLPGQSLLSSSGSNTVQAQGGSIPAVKQIIFQASSSVAGSTSNNSGLPQAVLFPVASGSSSSNQIIYQILNGQGQNFILLPSNAITKAASTGATQSANISITPSSSALNPTQRGPSISIIPSSSGIVNPFQTTRSAPASVSLIPSRTTSIPSVSSEPIQSTSMSDTEEQSDSGLSIKIESVESLAGSSSFDLSSPIQTESTEPLDDSPIPYPVKLWKNEDPMLIVPDNLEAHIPDELVESLLQPECILSSEDDKCLVFV